KVAIEAGALCWGEPRQVDLETPALLVVGGRNDLGQKGLDVCCVAIRRALETGVDATFVFCPLPDDDGLEGLAFIEALAAAWPNRILALPSSSRELWMAALQAASFSLLPSFHEPFGSAAEVSMNGTIPIARATGGLVQTVVPLIASAAWSPAVQARAVRYHSLS